MVISLKTMRKQNNTSRRSFLRRGALSALALTMGVGASATSAAARSSRSEGDFGRIWVRGEQWRTHVIDSRKPEFEPHDPLVSILGYGTDGTLGSIQSSTSPGAPGDKDYNGGQWHRYGVIVLDKEAYKEVAPFTSTEEAKEFVETGGAKLVDPEYLYESDKFSSPVYFNCPLTGKAMD